MLLCRQFCEVYVHQQSAFADALRLSQWYGTRQLAAQVLGVLSSALPDATATEVCKPGVRVQQMQGQQQIPATAVLEARHQSCWSTVAERKDQHYEHQTHIMSVCLLRFLACSDHWRKNTQELGQRFRAYSIDLLGYGFSDKPDPRQSPANSIYNFDTWGQQLVDFTEQVIGAPAYLSCNSVGGTQGGALLRSYCMCLVRGAAWLWRDDVAVVTKRDLWCAAYAQYSSHHLLVAVCLGCSYRCFLCMLAGLAGLTAMSILT
jgi:hypothetical protein